MCRDRPMTFPHAASLCVQDDKSMEGYVSSLNTQMSTVPMRRPAQRSLLCEELSSRPTGRAAALTHPFFPPDWQQHFWQTHACHFHSHSALSSCFLSLSHWHHNRLPSFWATDNITCMHKGQAKEEYHLQWFISQFNRFHESFIYVLKNWDCSNPRHTRMAIWAGLK